MRLVNIFCQYTVLVCLLLITGGYASASTNLQADSFEIYFGDVNGDGYDDIYLKAEETFLIIAAEINIPIPLPAEFQSYVIWGESGGTFNPEIEARTVSDLSGFTQLESYVGMFVSGSNELLIRAHTTSMMNLVVGGLLSNNPSLLSQFGAVDGFDFSGGSNEVLTVGDFNGDGWTDIRRTYAGFNDVVALNDAGSFSEIIDTIPTYTEENYIAPIIGAAPDTKIPTLVGSTASQLTITSGGAASYSVPIVVPPGLNGLQPKLALNYNSSRGNGLLGQGWALNGLSEISRCPSTIAQDNKIDAVDYDRNDRFCLDGKKLVVIDYGMYGATNSEYRTEIDSYGRIKSLASTPNSECVLAKCKPIYQPGYFTVETKSGLTMTYGASTDSKIEAQNDKVHKWLLNQVKDRSGNYYTINYEEDTENGNYRPSSIEYGFHETKNSNALAKVEFKYEPRNDNQAKYYSQTIKRSMERLKTLNTFASENSVFSKVRSYTLNYASSGVGSLSKIQSIQECDANGACLPALDFDWEEETLGNFTESTTTFSTRMSNVKEPITSTGSSDTARIKFGDFNGDGLKDIYYISSYAGAEKVSIYLSSLGGGYTEYLTNYTVDNRSNACNASYPSACVHNLGLRRVKLGDFDGNGLTDVYRIMPRGSTGYDKIEYSFLDSTGNYYTTSADTSFTTTISDYWGCPGCVGFAPAAGEEADLKRFHFGDYNGDGLLDVLKLEGYNSEQPVKVYLAKPGVDQLGQFTEIVSNMSIYYVYLNSSTSQISFESSRFRTADFNGDGLTDFYMSKGGTHELVEDSIYLSNGDGSFILPANLALPRLQTKVRPSYDNDFGRGNFDHSTIKFGDFNGDGKTDVLDFGGEGSSTHRLNLSIGDGSFKTELITFPFSFSTNLDAAGLEMGQITIVDMNGDGKSDLYRVLPSDHLTDTEKVGTPDEIYYSNGDGTFKQELTNFSTYLDKDRGSAFLDLARFKFSDLNGDGLTDVYFTNGGTDEDNLFYKIEPDTIHLSSGIKGNRINSFTNSLGLVTGVNYLPLTNSGVYEKQFEAVYPQKNITPSLYVVNQISQADGDGGTAIKRYKYAGMKVDSEGRGSLGFSSNYILDLQTNIFTETNYKQGFPYTGRVAQRVSGIPKEKCLSRPPYDSPNCDEGIYITRILSSLSFDWVSQPVDTGASQVHLAQTAKTTNLFDDNLIKLGSTTTTTTTTNGTVGTDGIVAIDADNYGNILESTTTVSDGSNEYSTKTVRTVDVNESNWLLSRQTSQEVTYSAPNKPDITNTVSFTYPTNDTKGLPSVKTIEPDSSDPSLKLITKYDYDAFGHLEEETACPGDIAVDDCTKAHVKSRHSVVGYTTDGRFMNSITNTVTGTLDHVETFKTDPSFGVITEKTDLNQLVTTIKHDSLGREILSSFDDTKAITERKWCSSNDHCPTIDGNAAYMKIISKVSGQAPIVQYLDQFSREIRNETFGFDGAFINVDTQYDSFGRTDKVSAPYFANDTIYWNEVAYDELGRVQSSSYHDSEGQLQEVQTNYKGFTTETVDSKSKVTSQTIDALGRVLTTTDAKLNTVKFTYDAKGNLLTTTDSATAAPLNVVTLSYDDYGYRKVALDDPDMGIWHYEYTNFGELYKQISRRSIADSSLHDIFTTFEYDRVGRIKTRTETNEVGGLDFSSWTYDSASGKGVGQIDTLSHTEAGSTHSKGFGYDSLGRLSNTFYSTDNAAYTGSVIQKYGQFGQLDEITYPTGFKAEYKFNQYGYIESVSRAGETTPIWSAKEMNARDQLVWADLGNGVTDLKAFNPSNGSLSDSIVVSAQGQDYHNLSYTYDSIGNVHTRTDNLQSALTETFIYDDLNRLDAITTSGGIESIDIQDYQYHDNGNIKAKSGIVGSYVYDNCEAGPHAVCQAGNKKYSYDVVGNLVKAENTVENSVVNISYTPFNKPKQIGSTQFQYGADRFRVKQAFVNSNSGNEITYYVGNGAEGGTLFEQTGDNNKHYIYAASAEPVAVYISSESITTDMEFFHRDALGSVVAVTDSAGTLALTASHDAFGLRRNANQTAANDPNALPKITGNEGYTGHEELPDLGLVHMNGRVYDPEIGRFLSADPTIPDPLNTQSYNRYSYVLNNPLNFVDPSGFAQCYNSSEKEVVCRTGQEYKEWEQNIQNQMFSTFDYFADQAALHGNDFDSSLGENFLDGTIQDSDNDIAAVDPWEYKHPLMHCNMTEGNCLPPVGGGSGGLSKAKSATEHKTIKPGTEEWKKAVDSLNGLGKGKQNIRTQTATDAKVLLKESRGGMDRKKNYTSEKYSKGYETHNVKNARELGAGNNLQHLKWKDGKSGGHIYYNKPN